ncbi:MAG: DUF2911 domain-containing protein [Gemmatimonadota bacterium]|nr:DUF2911 domain-containing protein [Gemmatimonadota bacterium]
MTPNVQRLACLSALLLSAIPAIGCAQPVRKSQLGGVTQQIADTRVEIIYRRPVARGRALFGALVPWGKIWSPSADSAAIVTISAPVDVNGHRLPAGSYALWAIPDSTTWTLVFSSMARAFHLSYPEGKDVLRVQASPRRGEHMETLAFYFPVVDADSATLNLHWGTTIVPMTLRVPDTRLH